MERVEGGPDFKKKKSTFHQGPLRSPDDSGRPGIPPSACSASGVFLVESLMPLCKRGQDKWRKKGGKRQTPLPRHARPSVRPSGFRLHGRRRTPVSSHIKYYKTNRRRISATDPPQSLYGDLEGVGGREGRGRAVCHRYSSKFF